MIKRQLIFTNILDIYGYFKLRVGTEKLIDRQPGNTVGRLGTKAPLYQISYR